MRTRVALVMVAGVLVGAAFLARKKPHVPHAVARSVTLNQPVAHATPLPPPPRRQAPHVERMRPIAVELPPLDESQQREQQLISTQFADLVKPAVARCFREHVDAHEGSLTFRYLFKPEGDRWVISDGDDALELVDSSIPESADDAALECMRSAVKGASLPLSESKFQDAPGYDIYWSWDLG